MRFRLPASLSDGISLPHHQIQAPGSFALMPENRLHFILLLTIDHYGRRRSLLPFELLGPSGTFSGLIHGRQDGSARLGEDPIRTPLEKSPWRLGKVQSSASVIWKAGAGSH